MQFTIAENPDGTFSIQKFEPKTVGTFQELEIAEKVMGFLVEEALDAMSEETASAPLDPAPLDAVAEPEARADTAQPKYQSEWTEGELERAFAQLCSGDRVKIVAEQYGKDWRVLRAKWAAEKKREAAVAPPPEDDMEECRLCGKAFRPTPDRLEVCARCDA